MPIEVTIALGLLGFGLVRLLSLWWPRHPQLRSAIWNLVFLTVLGRVFLVVIALLAGLDAITHRALAENVALGLWPVVAIALGLELVWRSVSEFLGPAAEIIHAPRTPWTHSTPVAPHPAQPEPHQELQPRGAGTKLPASPSPSVVGSVQRLQPSRSAPRAPAAVLSRQPSRAVTTAPAAALVGTRPSLRPVPAMRLYGPMPPASTAHTHRRFKRNVALLLAQLVALTQGVIAILNGVNAHGPKNNVVAAMTIVIGAAVVVAAVFVVRPSRVARFLLILWELVAMLFTIGVLVHAQDLVTVFVSAAGVGVIQPLVAFALQAVILYGLLLHPATRDAFAR